MDNGAQAALYSLVSLSDFKSILGFDDRENTLSRYCLVTATYAIEQYCKRRLIRRKHTDYHTFSGQHIFTLREYPVRKILSVYSMNNEQLIMNNGELIGPEFYRVIPECGDLEDIPYYLSVSPELRPGVLFLKVRYAAGYVPGKVPADLAAACLELAVWNMNRYRGRRIGMAGAVRGNGEQPEASMPENVRLLLEPYKRRVI